MTGNAKIGAALVGGYLLGRTKKAKLAIGFGMFLAGKKLSLDPRQLGRMLADSPLVGGLNDQVRKELVGATKTAATNALTQRATGLADSLHKRTLELEDPSGAKARDEEDEADGESEDDDLDGRDEQDDKDKDSEGAEEKPAPRRGTAAKKAAKPAAKSAGGARRTASGGARKKAAPAARKATSGARAKRGGNNG
jgi:hypothetical protein